MIREYHSIIGAPFLGFETGETLALLKGTIIHPDTGKIEAFWVRPLTGLPLKNAIIQAQDILEWKKSPYVKNESVIADPADVIRITDILEQGRPLLGNAAQNEAGDSYGRVISFDFKDDTLYLNQIYTQKSLLGLFPYEKRIFSLDNVVEVLPDRVIVRDDSTKKETAPAASFVNKTIDLDLAG